ncbi:hypothetical protein [Mycolicibacterium litorale]|uniref:Transmembrane protein n=1 Tax=Mycolicibacterium litorale TaxID=758802 RepID=A0AAD1MVK8_9MYCO|nr:hypothetical protein [Mycolicibacterium litorale]MCV7416787.1 hypothetical protein [Mycolicibacterium litorale]TDY04572.1 hypothetical protein BCL50_3347 [Mycolicibacterium litorale]BBY17998.1 hypothetical protein MLIT_35900 [Mycolicibacterium litorale]
MRPRAWYVAIGGAILLAIGLFALRFPVFIDGYDQWGWQINCGSGFVANLTQAENAAVDGTDFVASCQSALLSRRLWTIPLIIVGSLALLAVLLTATITHQDDEALAGDRETP